MGWEGAVVMQLRCPVGTGGSGMALEEPPLLPSTLTSGTRCCTRLASLPPALLSAAVASVSPGPWPCCRYQTPAPHFTPTLAPSLAPSFPKPPASHYQWEV